MIAVVSIGTTGVVLGVRYFQLPSAFAGEGATYAGEMVGGVPHGHGTLVERDGDRYDGDWLNGRRHGKGREYTAERNGTVEGTWKEGRIIEE